jgi:hypothetical protein
MALKEILLAFIAGAGGALSVKAIELWIRRSEKKETAKNIIKKNLDPILKATDDLVGKLYSLQRKDFLSMPKKADNHSIEKEIETTNLSYYFANFWARIQILRQESIYVNLNSTTEGKHLQNFIRTLEIKEVRLLDRALQRGIGESIIIKNNNGQLDTLNYFEFVEKYDQSARLKMWFEPLCLFFNNLSNCRSLQRTLVYGEIVHSLLDTLDSKHYYARKRPAWPNKLTKKNRKDLRFRIFKNYLPFVKNPEKYFNI